MSVYDRIRSFWNNQPCGSRNSDKEKMTKDYFDEIERNRYFVEPHVPPFAQFDKWKGKRVLEIGCGIGTDSLQFSRAGADITVVDFSDKSLEMCKARFKLYGCSGTFYHGNAEELDSFLPLQTFDLIWSFGVIHHTPHPERVIQQLIKYCKPETEFRFMVYSKVSWKLFWMMLEYGPVSMANADKLIQTYSEAQTGCPVTYTYTSEEIKDLIGKNFEIEKIWKDHIFIWNVEEYRQKRYVVDKYWIQTPQSTIDEYAKELGWHLLVIARPNLSSSSGH